MMIHIRSPTALNMPPQDGGKPPGNPLTSGCDGLL